MNRAPANAITEDDIRAYEDDGVVCLRQMFDREWVDRMREASLRYMESGVGDHRVREAKIPGESARFYINSFMSVYDREFLDFRNESPAAEIGATLMGVDRVRFWYDQMFVKDAGTSAPTQWHHDLPFWPFLGEHLVSIWVALTPATKRTGGLEYMAGSHKWGKFYCPVTPDEDAAFTDPDLEPCPNFTEHHDDPTLRFLSWDVEAGDCICHHPLAVHGAGGNAATDRNRMAISIRYLGEDVQWDPRPHVMTLPEWPDLPKGAYPDDDSLFPVIWERGELYLSRRSGVRRASRPSVIQVGSRDEIFPSRPPSTPMYRSDSDHSPVPAVSPAYARPWVARGRPTPAERFPGAHRRRGNVHVAAHRMIQKPNDRN